MGEIKKQSIFGTTLSYLGVLIAFFNLYVQSHLIPTEDIGVMRLILSFSLLIATIMPLGIGPVILRYFPAIRDENNRHNGFFALILSVVVAGGVLVAAALTLTKGFFISYYQNSPGLLTYYYECIAASGAIAINAVLTVYTASLLKTVFPVFLNEVYLRLGQLVLILLYHYDAIDREGFFLLNLALFGTQLLLLLFYLRSIGAVSFRIRWDFYRTLNRRQILSYGSFMAFTGLTSLGIKYIDQLMIGHFLSEYEIGIYSTAVMICVVIEVPLRSLERIAQPKIAQAWSENNMQEIASIYEKSSRYMFFVGAVIFSLLWANVDVIFSLLPAEFNAGRNAFLIITVSSLVNLLTGVNTTIIVLSPRYYIVSGSLALLMITLILLNNQLIPEFGIQGAALAVLIGYTSYNMLMYLYNLLVFRMQPFSLSTLAVISGLLVFGLISHLMPSSWNWLISAGVKNLVVVVLFLALSIRFAIVEELNHLVQRQLNVFSKRAK